MALIGAGLVGFVGVAVDTGYTVLTGHQLQTVAEAAALAAVQELQNGTTEARDAAVAMGAANQAGGVSIVLDRNNGNSATGDVVVGHYDAQTGTFDPGGVANAVRVTARRTSAANGQVGLFFGSVFGVGAMDMTRSAIASLSTAQIPGLLVLNKVEERTLNVPGVATLNVAHGGIHVNSNHAQALSVTGSGGIVCDERITVVGGYHHTGSGSCSPAPMTGQPLMTDPLASLVGPSSAVSMPPVNMNGSQVRTIGPGYYNNGIQLSANARLTMQPGIYVVDGPGFRVTGNASVTGNGVMIYLTSQARLTLTGTGGVTLAPPDPAVHGFPGADTYAGITVFQDFGDSTPGTIGGNGVFDISGLVYMPTAPVTITGTGNGMAMSMIVDRLNVTGNGTFHLNSAYQSMGSRAYLVK